MSKSCANCGVEISEGARFCDNCGMPISETPPQAAPTHEVPAEPPDSFPTPPAEPSPPVIRSTPDLPSSAMREDEQPVWRWYRVPIFLLVLLFLALLGGTAYALIRGTSEDVAVPNLVGASSVEEAQEMAGGNFEVVEGDGVESREPAGIVVEQDPAAGEMAGEGSTIFVNVSEGVNLPDIRGKARDEAVRLLERAGFEVEEETEESSAENEGYVIKQDPRGGRGVTVEAGSNVKITVGDGPARVSPPPQQAPVPPKVSKKAEEPEPPPPPPPPPPKDNVVPPPPSPSLPPPPQPSPSPPPPPSPPPQPPPSPPPQPPPPQEPPPPPSQPPPSPPQPPPSPSP